MKQLSIVKYILLVVSALAVLLYFTGTFDVDFMLYCAYALLGLALASVVLLPIYNIVKNPHGAVRSLIGLAIVVVVLGVAFALSSDIPIITPVDKFEDSLTLKLSDTGLYATYAAMIATFVAIVVGEVGNIFK